MIDRPSRKWRATVEEQVAAVDAGTLDPAQAYAAELWPADFITAVDAVLDAYERDVAALSPLASDEAIWAAVERAVVGLNEADEPHAAIETGEREDLAEYLDTVLTRADIDVSALTARQGKDRSELTDDWRDW